MAACIGRVRGHDRGRPGGNVEFLEEMRELRARLESMETYRRRDPKSGYVSEPEDEEQREEAAPMQETLIKMFQIYSRSDFKAETRVTYI